MNAWHTPTPTPTPVSALARLGQASPGVAPPRRRVLGGLVAAVLVVHLAVLWGMTGPLEWRLDTPETLRVAPLQTRNLAAAVLTPTAAPVAKAPPRTRLATLPSAPKEPTPALGVPALPEAASALPPETDATKLAASAETTTNVQRADTPAAAPAPETTPETAPQAATQAVPTAAPNAAPDTALSTPLPPPAAGVAATALAETSTSASPWPPVPLGALPPPVLLSYRLTGQDKGMNYFASGEMRWQHNETAYALSLSVKAFLVGSRHWRSVGDITASGLAPRRFSDSWRSERATHFDRANQRVVFSSNAPVVPLEAGAQDQISLYVQLAAAMAGEPRRFEPGTRLQLQTATTKDASPWLLTLGDSETLQLESGAVKTVKWVCQPRNRFDATVAFWVSAQHAWMPVRIRITQVSGSFIDLQLTDQQTLPPLPTQTNPPEKTTPS